MGARSDVTGCKIPFGHTHRSNYGNVEIYRGL